MKILIVNKFLHPNGGSETYIFKLGEELIRQGHEVQYFGMENQNRIVGNHAEVYINNMDFHTGKIQKLLYPFKIIYSREAEKKMRKVLEDFKPDVVHLNNFNFQLTPSIIYAVKKYEKEYHAHVRIIYTAHDVQLVCPNHLMQNPVTLECCEACLKYGVGQCAKRRCIHGSRLKSILGVMEAKLYKLLKTYQKLDVIICPSNFLKSKLDTDSVLSQRTIVLRNFVDMEIKRCNLPKQDYVLYYGRYSSEKGIGTLLKACEELPKIPFHFAGSGPLEEDIRKVKNIKLCGFLTGEGLVKEITQAKFVVFPSECYENCPFTVMESQLCKTPVLGSNLGGIPELINDGVTGELFESGNEKMLTEKIKKFWTNPELLQKYSDNCSQVQFDNVKEYVIKLLRVYNDENIDAC